MKKNERNLIISSLRASDVLNDEIAVLCGHKYLMGKIMENVQELREDEVNLIDSSYPNTKQMIDQMKISYTEIINICIMGISMCNRLEATLATTGNSKDSPAV